ncbi:MAG: hypothetical protein N3A58_08880 [Spirochaetes bacterium]|nr:hypothetical protein [Spirochaetota bacterium]
MLKLKLKILIVIFLFIYFIIPPMIIIANPLKIIKVELFYVENDLNGNISKINFRGTIRWAVGKILNFRSKINIKNIRPFDARNPFNISGDVATVEFKNDNIVYLDASLEKTFFLPISLTAKYFFNDKEIKPDEILKNKANLNGTLRIEFYARSLQTYLKDINYQKFPDNSNAKISTNLIIPYIIIITNNSQINIASFRDIEVTSGTKYFFGDNININLLMITYPDAKASITFKGNMKNLPSFIATCSPLNFNIPNQFLDNIKNIDNALNTIYQNYQLMKEFLKTIIDTEAQIIEQIDIFYKTLSGLYPYISSVNDLLNLYSANLEKVIKLNNAFLQILKDMKDYLSLDENMYQKIVSLFELNNKLIKVVLEGVIIEEFKAPGIYDFPQIIDLGEFTLKNTQNILIQFNEGSKLIRDKLIEVKSIFESYEKDVIETINNLRIEREKAIQIFQITPSLLDYIIFIIRDFEPEVVIERNVQFIFKFNFEE